MYKNEYFTAFTNEKLEATDQYLPLNAAAAADLRMLLTEPDDYIYLSLKSDTDFETVKVRNEQGTLLMERGVEGTTPVAMPYGTCVVAVSPSVIAAVKDLVCNHKCCEGECPTDAVQYSGHLLPIGHTGVAWEGVVIFSGDLPMNIVLKDAPAWMQAVQTSNTLQLSGTPDVAGTTVFSVAATNGNGTNIDTKSLQVTVTN